jgi:hypothetical protein
LHNWWDAIVVKLEQFRI